ncbi:MAG: formylglycine-generating enzyme family protein, partial [Leptolyngbya sp. SIO4C5]|nr:formylglycine-generating enzyme family protein [Leptolyngbya sp. SIO4C5]
YYKGPQHQVSVSAFFMGRFPITQAQYQAVMGKNPSHFSENGASRPVEEVSWEDAVAFCNKLSQQIGRIYRLPSEAEWEYACRAGTTTPFHFGETITTDLANYRGTDWEYEGETYPGNYGEGPHGSFREETTEVGIFPPNDFGIHDMHGNVWEWCQDVWHDSYEGAPPDSSAWLEGGEQGKRVVRGGSWCSMPRFCRSAFRVRFAPADRYHTLGFRVVCVSA